LGAILSTFADAAMLSITAGVQEYIRPMFDTIPGMKVLILDNETTSIISMVFSQSDIIQHEVFLTEKIDSENQEKMRHLNAICFLRPTNNNFLLLSKELRAPRYNEYHIFFTNCVPHDRFVQLACCDEYEVVHQVEEHFADVYAINNDLFSLNLPSTIRLTEDHAQWTSYEESVIDRIIEGLLAASLALRMMPVIRYTASSQLTQEVARRFQQRIMQEQSLFDTIEQERGEREPPPVLLVLDRRDDPVTPLLNQWTYQAMLHELLAMDNNHIDMSNVPDIKPENKEIIMSIIQDNFFNDNVLSNYGDLGDNVKRYVEEYQESKNTTAKIDTVEDLQRFLDDYPDFCKQSANVSKHVAVVHELSRIIAQRGLLKASQLEQDIACSQNRQEHNKKVWDMVRGTNVTNMERLRLVLLYALRYEHDSSILELKQLLSSKGIGEEQIALVDQLLQYAGSHIRSGDLFQNKSFFASAKGNLTRGLKGIENVYTEHKSQVHSIADRLMRGKLEKDLFPFLEHGSAAGSKEKMSRAMIFVVGGTTFEEARDVAELNKTLEGGRGLLLGGTSVHNSRSFLADLAQLTAARGGPE